MKILPGDGVLQASQSFIHFLVYIEHKGKELKKDMMKYGCQAEFITKLVVRDQTRHKRIVMLAVCNAKMTCS